MSRLRTVIDIAQTHDGFDIPGYNRELPATGIAHLGMGNFHRAHQAYVIDRLLHMGPENWMIHGIGMMEPDSRLIQAMQAQDCLYSLTERSGAHDKIRIIGSIKQVSHAPTMPESVIELLASDNIRIISLTVTEKGYCNTPEGQLDTSHPMILHDLAADTLPVSALGYLYAAAARRMADGGQPVTVMSCDNLPGNGDLTARLLRQFAERKDAAVAEWIKANMSFPNSMVDRITPVVTPATKTFVADTFGIDDACPVVSESFFQWVLEDTFINGRPDFEAAGVQLVTDVKPYEILKTRLLNGAHSALSYASYLMGHRMVDVAMADPLMVRYLTRYMDEDVTPTVPEVPGINTDIYKQTLRSRFANPAISDQVQRLAQDGSAKIRSFIVPPLTEQLRSGGSITWLVFALASWYRYLRGVDEQGEPIEINDPMADVLRGNLREASELLAFAQIFDHELATNSRLLEELRRQSELIDAVGTRQALETLLNR